MAGNFGPTLSEWYVKAYEYLRQGVQSWSEYIERLELSQKARESQLVPFQELSGEMKKEKPHANIKVFSEENFLYNLNGQTPYFTENKQVNQWIRNFARLNIDIFRLVRYEHTLPDDKFLTRRYFALLKQYHPDKNMNGHKETVDLNVGQVEIEELYDDRDDQILLFQTILDQAFVEEEKKNAPIGSANPILVPGAGHGSAPYILLFLVGASVGFVYVKIKSKKS